MAWSVVWKDDEGNHVRVVIEQETAIRLVRSILENGHMLSSVHRGEQKLDLEKFVAAVRKQDDGSTHGLAAEDHNRPIEKAHG